MSEHFYSVKYAKFAGVEIDWYNVQLADGTYVYMLSLKKLADALKLHHFTVARFCKSKGWNPYCYEVSSAAQISQGILKLNVTVNTHLNELPTGNGRGGFFVLHGTSRLNP